MNDISPSWRRGLSGGPLRSATFWFFFILLGLILEASVSLIARYATSPTREFLDIPIVTLVLVLSLNGYGFWLVIQAYQDARAAIGTESEKILARYSYLIAKMYIIAGGCTLLCLRVAAWMLAE